MEELLLPLLLLLIIIIVMIMIVIMITILILIVVITHPGTQVQSTFLDPLFTINQKETEEEDWKLPPT